MFAWPAFLFNVGANENQVVNVIGASLLEYRDRQRSGVDPLPMKHSVTTILRKDRT